MVKLKQCLKCVLAPNAMALVREKQTRLADLVAVLLLVAGVSLVLALAAMAVLARLPERTDCSPRLGRQVSARCLTMCLLELPSPRGLSRAVPAALVLPVAQPQPQPLR